MTELLLKKFIKNYKDVSNNGVREKYGVLSGIVGIIVNVILSGSKFLIGTMSNSIAIVGDALNNLSDVGSCFVTLFAFKVSSRRPDKEHPFGHGRIEYIAALVVGLIVELMGVELLKSSIEKVIHPQQVVFSYVSAVVLLISIFGKLYLAIFNKNLGLRIASPALSASVKDSISDIASTTVTLLALILSQFTKLPLDGIFGAVVSLFILYSGYEVLKESIGIILGTPPSKEFVENFLSFVKSFDGVLGTHDLVIHSYGENRMFASVHIEVPDSMSINEAHEIADNIESLVYKQFKLQLVAHIDPITTCDEEYDKLRLLLSDILTAIDTTLTFHDFRIVKGKTHTNLVFDIVIPFDFRLNSKELSDLIQGKISENNPNLFVVATIEYNYT